jgi:HD-GYP domain-containing protein (c-di-GMP phosphodiesterase class II)
LAEALAALSLATDLGNGVPLETSLRHAVIAARVAERAGLRPSERSAAFYVALLRSIGCTAFAHENALLLGDDIAFQELWHRMDRGNTPAFLRDVATGMGAWAPNPAARARIALRFLRAAPTAAPEGGRSGCEVVVSLSGRLELADEVAAGLTHVLERYDGKGVPAGVAGEEVALGARVAHLAEVAEGAQRRGGVEGARAEVKRRSGGHLDPALAQVFLAEADDLLAGLDGDALAAALAAEPAPHLHAAPDHLDRVALALADFADLKSPWTLGHSTRTAELAAAAVAPEEAGVVRRAALLHDLGRVSVPNTIWDKAGPLSAADTERVRLHPHWTQRILARTPPFAPLAPLAAADHERLDGSGYHRGVDAAALDARARALAAADAYAAMVSDRPQRPALSRDAAAGVLREEARAGRLCPQATEAVLEAAGHAPRRRPPAPHGLTDREIEVLRLAVRGLTNKQIAHELVVSPRTVQHHLAHVYEKSGRRTRAGAALWAMEQGLAR